eukprot:6202592-Pleurochrysis_carterae.AAC.2
MRVRVLFSSSRQCARACDRETSRSHARSTRSTACYKVNPRYTNSQAVLRTYRVPPFSAKVCVVTCSSLQASLIRT